MRTILSFFIGTVLLLPAGLLAAGCGGSESSGEGESGISVSAGTTHLADLARNVAGERAEVAGILSPSSDPHDYEPKPSDAESLLDADLILRSGGDLDLWLDQLVESSGSDAPVLTVLDSVETIEGGHAHGEEEHSEGEEEHAGEEEHSEGDIDPHWWQSPANAIAAVGQIRDRLVELDPEGAPEYEANADAYKEELERLDRGIAACIDRVPEEQRRLVTSHDALGYYADRYGIEIVGAAIPALTTQAQASAGETAELVDLIRETEVETIFAEAGVSAELETAIAAEAGATVGGELWADALGPEGSDGATYIEAMRSNTARLVDGFSGGAEQCTLDAVG